MLREVVNRVKLGHHYPRRDSRGEVQSRVVRRRFRDRDRDRDRDKGRDIDSDRDVCLFVCLFGVKPENLYFAPSARSSGKGSK